jgi:hypothetical protein
MLLSAPDIPRRIANCEGILTTGPPRVNATLLALSSSQNAIDPSEDGVLKNATEALLKGRI